MLVKHNCWGSDEHVALLKPTQPCVVRLIRVSYLETPESRFQGLKGSEQL